MYKSTLPYSGGKMLLAIDELNEKDHGEMVEEMDLLSGNNVHEWLDSGMAYGLIRGMELVAYLTVGYADECGEEIESHPHHHSDARILSNVFVKEEYRNRKFAHYLIQQVLDEVSEVTYLTLLDERLQSYYQQLRFEPINEHSMVRLVD